jgi:exodeoxyribonuclease VII large subunit
MVSTSREELYKRVIELKTQLITTIRQKTERVSLLLRQFTPEYLEKNFQMLMQPFLMRLDDAKEELVTTITTRITEAKHKVSLLESRLEAGSPLHILKKGYAVVTDPSTRQIIKAAKHTAKGKAINVRFAEDALNATVEEIKEEIQNEEF